VRRDQAATIIASWLGLDPVAEDVFTDTAGNTHRQLINALAEVGVARGTTAATYAPADPLRRDQVASFLQRALAYGDEAAA